MAQYIASNPYTLVHPQLFRAFVDVIRSEGTLDLPEIDLLLQLPGEVMIPQQKLLNILREVDTRSGSTRLMRRCGALLHDNYVIYPIGRTYSVRNLHQAVQALHQHYHNLHRNAAPHEGWEICHMRDLDQFHMLYIVSSTPYPDDLEYGMLSDLTGLFLYTNTRLIYDPTSPRCTEGGDSSTYILNLNEEAERLKAGPFRPSALF